MIDLSHLSQVKQREIVNSELHQVGIRGYRLRPKQGRGQRLIGVFQGTKGHTAVLVRCDTHYIVEIQPALPFDQAKVVQLFERDAVKIVGTEGDTTEYVARVPRGGVNRYRVFSLMGLRTLMAVVRSAIGKHKRRIDMCGVVQRFFGGIWDVVGYSAAGLGMTHTTIPDVMSVRPYEWVACLWWESLSREDATPRAIEDYKKHLITQIRDRLTSAEYLHLVIPGAPAHEHYDNALILDPTLLTTHPPEVWGQYALHVSDLCVREYSWGIPVNDMLYWRTDLDEEIELAIGFWLPRAAQAGMPRRMLVDFEMNLREGIYRTIRPEGSRPEESLQKLTFGTWLDPHRLLSQFRLRWIRYLPSNVSTYITKGKVVLLFRWSPEKIVWQLKPAAK